MVVCYKISELKKCLAETGGKDRSIGFVPTMGALHKGHLKLLNSAREENQVLVASIFVNPIQFNNPEDYNLYPRDDTNDLSLMERAHCDVVFVPNAEEIYPQNPTINLNFGTYESGLEGAFRPGHFSGVGVVLSKFFNIIRPDRAYFGQKDLQQCAIVSKLVEDLAFGIEVRIVPTMREDDGLAYSSRNHRLSDIERGNATRFYEALNMAKVKLLEGESIDQVRSMVTDFIQEVSSMQLEYFEIVDSRTLEPTISINYNEPISLCIAGYVGEVRLLDNLYLTENN